MYLIFGLVREGIGFLGFGGYVGMVSRLWRMNRITVSRKVCLPTVQLVVILILYLALAIRVEWCKARACAHRWEEEVRLLFEEMQRTLRFLEWHTNWWMERCSTIMTSDEALSEGWHAYAVRQAELRRQIARSFAHIWRDTQSFLDFADARGVS